MTLSLAVLASGRGSNFRAIHKSIIDRRCDARIVVLISDRYDAPVIEYAKEYNIPTHIIARDDFESRFAHDDAIISTLDEYNPDLIILAGYMRVLKSSLWFSKYKNHILNIHPSLLPKYKGMDAQKQAFEAGEKESGCTIHIVDESLDGGSILYQKKVDISDCKNSEQVIEKILEAEHESYPFVIDKIAKGEITL
jgi:phosphoribosylglycinamide formyltransferase 1